MNDLADFFVTGGTLRPQAPSYVTRPADQELFDHVLAGDFCYVLTARQMGKSSLMVRTTRRLKEAGVATAIIDLTGIGETQADIWYIGLLTKIKKDLQLSVDVALWWRERVALGPPQRLIEFLHDIALVERTGPIAIFVDEIDSTLALNFRDDFFAAIRAMYNARASDSAYSRLTFVLLGVATPTDLISDRQRTPFNIGRRIVLQEFGATDVRPLQQGLEAIHLGQSDAILTRIFYWTNGHPYLTQKLCAAAAQAAQAEWFERDVDALVETSFFTKEARKESNLQFVQDRIRSSLAEERRRMLKLYRQLYDAKTIPDDDRSPIQNHLELSGLVGVEAGKLRIRNRIYQRVFDRNWIADNTPANTQLRITVAASIFTLMLILFIVYRTLNTVGQAAIQADVCVDNFEKSASPAVRLESLACLFDRPGYSEQALRLFYEKLSPSEQKYLFLSANPQTGEQTVKVVKDIYGTLDDALPNDRDLMDAMIAALNAAQQPEVNTLIQRFESWKKGRNLAETGDYAGAVEAYGAALDRDKGQPALRYDRAIAYGQLGRYDEAIAELDTLVRFADTITSAVSLPATVAPASRFASASGIVAATHKAISSDERLLAALLARTADSPALAAAVGDIVQAARVTQTARAEAMQIALAKQATEIAAEATQIALAKQATKTAAVVAASAPTPTEPPPPPTDTPVPPTPVPPTPEPVTTTPTPDSVLALLRSGRAKYIKGDYDGAVADFSQAIASQPDNAQLYYNRGRAYFRKRDNDNAIADYSQAIKLNPSYIEAYVERGDSTWSKKDFDQARPDFDKAIQLTPHSAEEHFYHGVAYLRTGEIDQAIADFTRTIKLQPNYVDAYEQRGWLYLFADGEWDKGIADYTQIIKLQPKNTDAYNYRATGYLNKGDYNQAIIEFNKLIKLGAEPVFWVYGAVGNLDVLDGFTNHLTQSVATDPSNSLAFYLRGSVRHRLDKKDEAITDFRKVLELNNDSELLKRAEDRLRELGAQ